MENVANRVVLIRQETYERREVRCRIERIIDELGGANRFFRPGMRVLLKPNLLAAAAPEKRVTTDPSVVWAVGAILKDLGVVCTIGDSPGIDPFASVAAASGMTAVAKELGIPCIELSRSVPFPTPEGSVFHGIELSSVVMESDAVVNLPKLKTHGQMTLTLGVKNLFGCVVAQRKAEWHYKVGLRRETFASLLLDIAAVVRPALTILDGIVGMEGDGPRNGTPRAFGLLAGAADPLALDLVLSRMLGCPPNDFPLARAARERGIEPAAESVALAGDVDASFRFANVVLPPQDSLHLLPSFLDGFGKSFLVSRPVAVRGACRGCGKCAFVCPAGAVRVDARGPVFDYRKCIRCYCCQEMCPHNAIRFRKGALLTLMRLFGR